MYAVVALLTMVALLVLARFALLIVRVDGTSMTPTYGDGERVLAVRRWLAPGLKRDSVVVLRHPPHAPVAGPEGTRPPMLVKRLVGLPGDENIPDGHVFVLGDGPGSYDSKTFGPVPARLIVGRVLVALAR
jgi:signal peptidase I